VADLDELNREVNAAIEAFELSEMDVDKRRRELIGRPDEDGFVTVGLSNRGKARADRASRAGSDAWGYTTSNRRSKQKRGSLEAKDFYSFQKREKQIHREFRAIRRPPPLTRRFCRFGRASDQVQGGQGACAQDARGESVRPSVRPTFRTRRSRQRTQCKHGVARQQWPCSQRCHGGGVQASRLSRWTLGTTLAPRR
jgi:hypothetical protein